MSAVIYLILESFIDDQLFLFGVWLSESEAELNKVKAPKTQAKHSCNKISGNNKRFLYFLLYITNIQIAGVYLIQYVVFKTGNNFPEMEFLNSLFSQGYWA